MRCCSNTHPLWKCGTAVAGEPGVTLIAQDPLDLMLTELNRPDILLRIAQRYQTQPALPRGRERRALVDSIRQSLTQRASVKG